MHNFCDQETSRQRVCVAAGKTERNRWHVLTLAHTFPVSSLFFARWRSEIILPLVFRFFLRRISLLGYKRHFARIPSAILIIFSIVSRNATFFMQVSIEFVFCCSCDLATDVLTYTSLQLTPVPLNRSFRIARIFLDEISFTHRRYACAQHSSSFFFLNDQERQLYLHLRDSLKDLPNIYCSKKVATLKIYGRRNKTYRRVAVDRAWRIFQIENDSSSLARCTYRTIRAERSKNEKRGKIIGITTRCVIGARYSRGRNAVIRRCVRAIETKEKKDTGNNEGRMSNGPRVQRSTIEVGRCVHFHRDEKSSASIGFHRGQNRPSMGRNISSMVNFSRMRNRRHW